MINYRIVRLAALHGLDVVDRLLSRHANFLEKTYKEQLTSFFQEKVLYTDSFSRSMCELGQKAYEIVWDFELLQKKWAKEHGVRYNLENWQFEIAVAQIEKIRPDVIYFQGTELLIPGRFCPSAATTNLATLLKQRFPFIRLMAMFSGFPTGKNRVVDIDVLFSCTPAIQEHYKLLGASSVLCYHAFDSSVLELLTPGVPLYDFTFAGSSRAPESRYWALRELLDKTNIKMWIDESVDPHKRKKIVMGKKLTVRAVRKVFREGVKLFFRIIGDGGIKTASQSDRIPKSIRRVAKELHSRNRSVGEKRFLRADNVQGKLPKRALKEIFPDRCRTPVSGQEYYQVLQSSRITFNRHTDATGESVGNMRMFESTGVGTCLLTDTGKNILDLFEPHLEVVTYTSMDDAVEKVNYLLDHDQEREQIARAGQQRTLKEHTIYNRCQLIDEVIRSRL